MCALIFVFFFVHIQLSTNRTIGGSLIISSGFSMGTPSQWMTGSLAINGNLTIEYDGVLILSQEHASNITVLGSFIVNSGGQLQRNLRDFYCPRLEFFLLCKNV